MMTRAQLVERLFLESCQPIPEPPRYDDSPATCARRRAELEAELADFVLTTAEKRQAAKVARHLHPVKGHAA